MNLAPKFRAHRYAAICLTLAFATAAAACGDDTSSGGGGAGAAGGTAGNGAGTNGGSGGLGGEGGGVAGMGGEGGMGFPPAPPLRNPINNMSDDQVAYESLVLMGYQPLGATNTTCTKCHALNSGLLNHWKDLTVAAEGGCFADTSLLTKPDAEEVLACFRQKPEVLESPYTTSKLGIYAAAAHLDWFTTLFNRVYDNVGAGPHENFKIKVGMPKLTEGFSQDEFDVVAEWFARGLPFLEEFVPEEPPPGGCIPSIGPEVAQHINAMATTGWRAANAENGLLMFGCAGAPDTLGCLSSYPLASSQAFGAGWEHFPGAKLRILRTNNFTSSYWTRSSADGRFVGHGGGSQLGSSIVDLLNNTKIPAQAAYDPGFFPDNSAFMFQGTPQGTGICLQTLLTASPQSVSFNEPECSGASQVGLYQHIGAALGGGDYWAVDGSFVSDDGGHQFTPGNPAAFFNQGSNLDLTPMINDGTDFVPKPTVSVPTPYEGDTVMSPSSGLLMGRVAGQNWNQNGFRMRKLTATPNGNSYDVVAPEVARYCFNGGKPGISFDERWAVIHRYVTDEDAVELGFTGPSDPAFLAYAQQGAANIYLMDLLTGLTRRVTHMQPGQYALFPHFRSDGWIYFIVRPSGQNQEYIVASDAALVVEGAN